MKRIALVLALCCVALTLSTLSLSAQTTDEIIAMMDEALEPSSTEGCSLIMDMKMPLLGTISSTMYLRGNKSRVDITAKGKGGVLWYDRDTVWEYDPEKNEITISPAKEGDSSDAEENLKMFDSVTEGYDVTLQKQTATAWYLVCKKRRDNPKKDDPKKMELVISKTTHLPLSLKSSLEGVTMTLRNVAIGVSEDQVTFNPEQYPTAKIIDKR